MNLKGYGSWVADGRVWFPARPIGEYLDELRRVPGVKSGDIGVLGDDAHLVAVPPQDHCPYSATGWPVTNPYPYVCALDYSGPSWEYYCDYWIEEARNGHTPWVKYINDGRGRQYTHWDGFRTGVDNSDQGHVHVSIRSDFVHATIGVFAVVPGNGFGEVNIMKLPILSEGSHGQGARNVQGLLVAHGLAVAVDGIFGSYTVSAVRSFQFGHRLRVDGVVGPDTWTTLLGG